MDVIVNITKTKIIIIIYKLRKKKKESIILISTKIPGFEVRKG